MREKTVLCMCDVQVQQSSGMAEGSGQEYLLTGQGLTIVMIFNDIDVVSHHVASISANQIPEFPESQIQILPPFVHFEVGFQPLKIFG